MRTFFKIFILALLLSSSFLNGNTDSLKNILLNERTVSKERLRALIAIVPKLRSVDTLRYYFDKIEAIPKLEKEADLYSSACFVVAEYCANSGKFELAVSYSQKGVEAAGWSGNDSLIAKNYVRMSYYRFCFADNEAAVDNCLKGISYAEKIKHERILASAYNMLGLILVDKNPPDFKRGLDYYLISEEMLRKQNNARSLGLALLRIGDVYMRMGELSRSEKYLNEALQVGEENKIEVVIKWTLEMFGSFYKKTGNHLRALETFNRSLEFSKKADDFIGTAGSFMSISETYLKLKEYDKTILYADSSIKVSLANELKNQLNRAYKVKAQAYEGKDDSKNALLFYKMHMSINDTILKLQNLSNINELEKKFNSEKQEKELAEQEKELLLQQSSIDRQQSQRKFFLAGILGLLVFVFFILRGYRNKQKANALIENQKAEVEKQKALLEIKQKEIIDSIRYAKRIQSAQMPSDSLVEKYLSRFKPKGKG